MDTLCIEFRQALILLKGDAAFKVFSGSRIAQILLFVSCYLCPKHSDKCVPHLSKCLMLILVIVIIPDFIIMRSLDLMPNKFCYISGTITVMIIIIWLIPDHVNINFSNARHHFDKLAFYSGEPYNKECPICYESKRNNIVLQCGHLFCVECMEQFAKYPSCDSTKCPMCKKRFGLLMRR